MKLPVQRISSEPRKIYLYSKGNYEAMNNYFLDIEWDSLLQAINVEENWRIFMERYHEVKETFIPHKTVKAGQSLKFPWTRYRFVKKARKHHRSLQVNQKKSQLFADGPLELEAKRNIDQAILKAKAHYENKIVDQSKENPKRFWNYTRHFTKSSSTIDVLEKEDTKVTDDKEKAEMLNNFFSSVLRNEPPDLPNFDSTPTPEFILKDFEITTPMIRKIMSKLITNKASGSDNISINIMKECLSLDKPLKVIFTQSLQTGQVPQEWRDANITPLFKKGNRASPNNYRPVSLTSQVVKIMERLIHDQILDLTKRNGTISCDQHGFQEQCSCVTQLLECLNDWTRNFDNQTQTDIIYLDFSRAFDTVPHNRLLLKLKKCGIRGKVLARPSSQIDDRGLSYITDTPSGNTLKAASLKVRYSALSYSSYTSTTCPRS